jgi:WD40 repeat protein
MANVWVAFLWSAVVVAGLLNGSRASAETRPEPPRASPPLLRIEAGRHTGGILRISADEQNRFVASVSLDKTVRIWELPTLQLQGVLRPPIGTGMKGALYAVALSPDGQTVACGGGEREVFVFQRATGQLTHRLQGLPNIITHLAYSRDGRWLVATLGGQHGIRLYDTRGYTQVDQDGGYGAASHYAEFSPDGRLITVSDDGYLRLYETAASGPDPLKLMMKRKLEGDRPRSAGFSPDGNVLAVGFIDHPRVELVSARDLAPVATLSISRADSDQYFISVAWSGDGKYVYAAGSYQERGKTGHKRGTTLIRRWSIGADRTFQDFPAAEGSIEQLLPLKNGSVVFASHDPALGTLDPSGLRTQFLSRPIADFRGMGDKFQVSDDATVIRFAYDRGESFAEFSLQTRAFLKDHDSNISLNSPFRGDSGFSLFGGGKDLRVEDWQDGPSPKLNGKPISLPPGEISRSLAVAPDREHFLLGTESKLRYFARDGTAQWRVSVQGIVWNVTIARNGRVAVAALSDGTIRWYRLHDGQELLAFYPHTDRKQWVVWTPKGYFDADGGAEELIGWHQNREGNQEADFYGASHFFEQFYHPELVARVLKMVETDSAALQHFGEQETVNAAVGFKRPPTVTLIAPTPSAPPDRDEIDVTVKAEDQGGGIGEIRLYHNDKLIAATTRGIAVTGDAGSLKQSLLTFHIRLVQGNNELRAVAISTDRIEGNAAEVRIPFRGVEKQAVLHLVAVGINLYQNSSLNLNFAQPDATAMLSFFSSVSPGLFRTVKVTQLFNNGATKSELLAKLQSLKQTAPEDVVIIYLAGHGESVGPTWYFVPHDVVYPERPEELQQKGLSSQEIKDVVMQIGAKKVLLLMDACKSGFALQAFSSRGLDERQALAQLARANGVHVVAASNKDQFASEVQELGHGVFTYTLLEGLKGQADGSPKDGVVTVRELLAFVEARLPDLSLKYRTERQYPVAESRGMDFPLAAIK